jgi:hypothetical protein
VGVIVCVLYVGYSWLIGNTVVNSIYKLVRGCLNMDCSSLSLFQDVGVTLLDNGQGRAPVEATTGRAERDVVPVVEDNVDFGEMGVVLDLGLADGRAVIRQDHQLGCACAQGLQGGLEA